MRRIPVAAFLLAAVGLSGGCADKGDGGGEPLEADFQAMVECTSTRSRDFGEFLGGVYGCLHSVDENHSHPGCGWTPEPCTVQPPEPCPPAGGVFTFTVSYGTIRATVRPALRSECSNGVGTNESCPFEWHTLAGSTVTGSGDMAFVELSPDTHRFTLALAEPVLEADGCRFEVTGLDAYLELGNLDLGLPALRDAVMMFEVRLDAVGAEILTGTAIFGHAGSVTVPLTFRGRTADCTLDVVDFTIDC